jgi:hypothetical protein
MVDSRAAADIGIPWAKAFLNGNLERLFRDLQAESQGGPLVITRESG